MFNRSKANLIDKYKRHVQTTTQPEKAQWSLKCHAALLSIREVLAGSPGQYHGSAFVNVKLDKDSHSTYWVAVVANGVNVLTSIPAFYFGFATLGPFGLLLTTTLSASVLKISNESAGAASGAAKGNRLWSSQGLMMFISLNVLLSIISGIGSELMINRSELRFDLASELISEQEDKLNKIKNDPDVQVVVQECAGLNKLIASLDENTDARRSAYGRAYGSYNNSKDYSQSSDAETPACILADEKKQEAQERYAPLEDKLIAGIASDNDLDFLEQNFSEVYEAHFEDNGDISSGAEKFRLAFESFYGRLLSGNFSDMGRMGFSLFMFLLSFITSSGACLMMVAHVCRKDTKLSHNPKVKDAIETHLAYLEKIIFKGEDSAELEDEVFLSPPPIQALKVSSRRSDADELTKQPAASPQVNEEPQFDFGQQQTPAVRRAIAKHLAYIERSIQPKQAIALTPEQAVIPTAKTTVKNSTPTSKVSEKLAQASAKSSTVPPSATVAKPSADNGSKRPSTSKYQPAR